MIHKAAHLSLSIKIVTSLVLLLVVAFLVGSIFHLALLIPGALLFVISALCYTYAPVGYEFSNNKLAVISRVGQKEFGPVVTCFPIDEKIPCSIRIWGNGGLFAGTGIFWNRSYGIFRVYVTSSRQSDLMKAPNSHAGQELIQKLLRRNRKRKEPKFPFACTI